MKKFTCEEEIEIINLYKDSYIGIELIATQFKVGKLKIKAVLIAHNIPFKKKGGQQTGITETVNNVKTLTLHSKDKTKILVAICKETGKQFNDVNNKSGCLTDNILRVYGDVPIPTNTFQRKKYELANGKKWYEEYYHIIEIEKYDNRYCKICAWATADTSNKTGCFENHLKNAHLMSIDKYLKDFPEEINLHPIHRKQIERNTILEDTEQRVKCLECNEFFIGLTNTHMKYKHSLSIQSYKDKWGFNTSIVNNTTSTLLSETAKEYNRNTTSVFTSKPHLELVEFITSLGLEVKNNDKSILKGIELDIVIFSKNLAVEFNGLYWHSERLGKNKLYHINKTILCENVGVKLIQIFEDEWRFKQDIVKLRLRNLLGVRDKSIYARKCIIREIESKQKNEYLRLNHLQGVDSSNIKLGAFYENELVGLMTFSPPRKALGGNTKAIGTYEMVRFVSNNVIGLASKFIHFFKNNYSYEKIITYADRRWTPIADGCMYEKIGFKYIGETQPNYWYTKGHKTREYRFNFRKSKLIEEGYDSNLTESQIMIERGYDKIWDCGSHKFELVNELL